MNQFRSLEKEASFETVVNRSKFICYISPVKHEIDATNYINKIRDLHKTATHNVYAYRLIEYNKKRYSDDGEPHKTAGLPILEVIEKNDLINVVAVVTRYFGGTLLGTGGLVRAYSNALLETLSRVNILTFKLCNILEVFCDYNFYGKISNIISDNFGVIEKTDFFEKIRIKVYIDLCNIEKFKKDIMEISSGTINFKLIGTDFLPM